MKITIEGIKKESNQFQFIVGLLELFGFKVTIWVSCSDSSDEYATLESLKK